jgi:hypothetical protein
MIVTNVPEEPEEPESVPPAVLVVIVPGIEASVMHTIPPPPPD